MICKLSYSNFVCAGYYTTVQMVSAENGRFVKNGPAHNIFDTYQIFQLPILSRAFACAQHSQSPHCLHTQRTVKKKAQAKLRRLSPLCSWPCMFSKRLYAYAKTTKYSCACSLSVSINVTNLCKRTTQTLHKKMTAY